MADWYPARMGDGLAGEGGDRGRGDRRAAGRGHPVAFLVGLIMMLLGHVIGGVAVFGASILAAAAAVVVAGMSGVAQLRRVISRQRYKVVQLLGSDYTRL